MEVEANPDILASAGVSGPIPRGYANASAELASETCKLSEYEDLKSLLMNVRRSAHDFATNENNRTILIGAEASAARTDPKTS